MAETARSHALNVRDQSTLALFPQKELYVISKQCLSYPLKQGADTGPCQSCQTNLKMRKR